MNHKPTIYAHQPLISFFNIFLNKQLTINLRQTGEELQLSAPTVPSFTAGKLFKDSVKG